MTEIEINVRGSHEITLPPERGTVRATLALEGPEPEPVFEAVVVHLARVKMSIESLHDEQHGPVTWYSFDQVRRSCRRPWNKDGKQLPLVHSAAVSIKARFLDFDELAKWVLWSAGVEGLTINYIDWELTEARRVEVERETRQQAVRDAKCRAQDYADALELGSVQVRSVSDPGLRQRPPVEPRTMSARASMAPAGGSPELTLRPEDVEISAEVEAAFVVRGRR